MPNFASLKKLEVTSERTAWYELFQIEGTDEGPPRLLVAPATEANKPYYNALLRRQQRNATVTRLGRVTAAVLEANRDDDRELFALHVVRNWERVTEDPAPGETEPKPVPFSVENCREFLRALPNWLFDDLRMFAMNPLHFPGVVDPAGTEEMAGNS